MRLAAAVLSIVCVMWLAVQGPGGGASSQPSEHERYLQWWRRQLPPTTLLVTRPVVAKHDPMVPFDLARMFRESDLVIRCMVGWCSYPREERRSFNLLKVADSVSGVYKGRITTNSFHLADLPGNRIAIFEDTPMTGARGYATMRDQQEYLLFLNEAPKEEVELRGYGQEAAKFYRVNRVWHGCIRLTGEGPGGNAANFLWNHPVYAGLKAHTRALVRTVEEMSADSRGRPDARRGQLLAASSIAAKLMLSVIEGKSERPKEPPQAHACEPFAYCRLAELYEADLTEVKEKEPVLKEARLLAALVQARAAFAQSLVRQSATASSSPSTGASGR